MAQQHAKVTMTKNGVPALLKALETFEAQRVLVGIPAATTSRSNTNSRGINNATIGAISEYGAPAAHIPARPWLHPGILSATDKIVRRYEGAAKRALKGDVNAIAAAHEIVGQETADTVRAYIRSAPFEPLKPATIAARARQRGTRRRKGEKEYLGLVRAGMFGGYAELAAGIRALINTGQFLRAISYVVVDRARPNFSRSSDPFLRKGPNTPLTLQNTTNSSFNPLAKPARMAAQSTEAGIEQGAEALISVAEGAAETVAVAAI